MTKLQATLVAAALLTIAAAIPANAQTLHFGLGIGANNNGDIGSAGDSSSDSHSEGEPDTFFRSRQFCILTDSGLRTAVEDEGYSDVFLNVPTGRYVQARATRGDWVYLLRLNVCTGDIVDRDRLRPAG